MSSAPIDVRAYDAIAKTVQYSIDGAKAGRDGDRQPAFHQDTALFGFADGELFAGPMQQRFGYVDHDAPATELQARLARSDIIDTSAAVRLALSHWNGHRYTDVCTLLNIDRAWKIMHKVCQQHPYKSSSRRHRLQRKAWAAFVPRVWSKTGRILLVHPQGEGPSPPDKRCAERLYRSVPSRKTCQAWRRS
jgi:Putative lumazine-binding